MNNTKIVTVGGSQFQLRKLEASIGSYIHWKCLGALMKQQDGREQTPEEKAKTDEVAPEEKAKLLVTLAFMSGLSYEDAQFAQRQAMQVVMRIQNVGGAETMLPVMRSLTDWADQELAGDSSMVSALTIESLAFSLACFFSRSGPGAAG